MSRFVYFGAVSLTLANLGHAMTSSARAADCALPITITSDVVKNTKNRVGYPGNAVIPPLVIGDQPSVISEANETINENNGTIVFVKRHNEWSAFMPFRGETKAGVFAGPAGDIFMFTWHTVEGPGSSWTLFHSDDTITSGKCVSIDFPDTLNKPTWKSEFLELWTFNMTKKGKAIAVGYADVEGKKSKSKTLWYKYVSEDSGATWSKPILLERKPSPRISGVYRKIAKSQIARLSSELDAFSLKTEPR